jgi:hypothetical protein
MSVNWFTLQRASAIGFLARAAPNRIDNARKRRKMRVPVIDLTFVRSPTLCAPNLKELP